MTEINLPEFVQRNVLNAETQRIAAIRFATGSKYDVTYEDFIANYIPSKDEAYQELFTLRQKLKKMEQVIEANGLTIEDTEPVEKEKRRNHKARKTLTFAQRREIFNRIHDNGERNIDLAKEYGVSDTYISKIKLHQVPLNEEEYDESKGGDA